MALYTTSRYASAAARRLARSLASASGGKCAARGKKTVEGLVALARRLGHGSIMIVEEKGGKPALVSAIRVRGDGSWEWMESRALPGKAVPHEGEGKD